MFRAQRITGAVAIVALSVACGTAFADPPGHSKGRCKNKHRGGGDVDVVVHVDTGPAVHHTGGPPPWAPAHGYRNKRRAGAERVAYVAPYGIDGGRCNRKELGIVLGGVGGALIGSRVASRDDRTAGIIGGAVIGAVVGGIIGNRMDKLDQSCVGQTLEHAPDGRAVAWQSEESGAQYRVTPTRTFTQDSGAYCREYQTRSVVSGREVESYGTACRQPDGSWRQIS